MGNDGINIKLGLQGDRELKSGLAAVNAEMKNLDSQMKFTKTVFSDSANSSEALRKKIEILSKEYSTQEQKINLQNKQLANSKTILKEAETNVAKYENTLEEANKKLEALSKNENASKEEIKEQSKAVKEAEEKLQKVNIQYNNAQKAVNNYQSDIAKSETKLANLNKELEQNKKYLSEAEASTDKIAKSIDEYGNEVKDAEEKTSTFGEVLKANLASDAIEAGISTIKDSLVQLGQIVDDLGTSTTKAANNFAAQTGASDEELQKFKKTMQEVYSDNFGESMDDISNSMATIKQNINNISPENLKKTTENAILLRDTFGFETEESIRAVKMLMDTFGTSAEEAYSMIAQGAQNGLNKNDDLLDTINEYSVQFKKSGYSAENMFNMLINGAKKGTFSVDKLGDAVKEFGIRASDGTADEAFKKLGLDAEKIKKMFNAGGESAKKASQTVMAAYSNMSDSSEKYLIGQQMFGTMFEDLGADAIESLMKVDGQVKNSTDTLKQINDIKYDDFDTTLEGIGRTIAVQFGEKFTNSMEKANGGLKDLASSVSNGEIKREIEDLADSSADLVTNFISFGVKAVPYITKGFKLIADHSTEVKSGLTGIAAAMITYKAATAIEAVVTSFKALKTAINSAETAQIALNTAQKANPIGLVTGLVVGLGTALISYATSSDKAKDSTDLLMEEIEKSKEKTEAIKTAIQDTSNAYEKNVIAAKTNATEMKNISDKLFELADKEKKSNAEKKLMSTYVAQLNQQYPNLGLKIDEVTGKLNKSKISIYAVINAMKQQAVQEALQEKYTSAVKNYVDAKEEAREEAERYKKAVKEQTEAEKAEEKAGKALNAATKTGSSNIAKLNSAYEKCANKTDKAKKATHQAKSKLEEQNKVVAKAKKELDNFGNIVQETSNDILGSSKKIKNSSNNINALEENLADLQIEYESTKKAAVASVQGQIKAFEKFQKNKTTFNTLLKNLQSNQKGIKEWGDNLAKISKTCSKEFVDYLRGMGISAAGEVQALAKATPTQLKKYEDCWKKTYNTTIPNAVEAGMSKTKEEIENIENKIAKAQSSKGNSAGSNYGDGFVSGINSKVVAAQNAAARLALAAHKKTKTTLDINSPSRVARKSGQWYGEGLAVGVEDKVNRVKKAVGSLSNAMSVNNNSASYGMSVNVNNQSSHTNNDNVDLVNATVNAVLNRFSGFSVVMDGEKVGNFVDNRVSKRLRGV